MTAEPKLTRGVLMLNLVPGTVPLSVAVCLILIGIKLYSWIRLHELPRPEAQWV